MTRSLAHSLSPALLLAALGAGCGADIPTETSDGGMNPDANPPAATGCTAPAMQAIQCDDKGMFADARAHWLAAGTIAWPASTSEASFELHYADCGIRVEGGEVVGSAGSVALLEDGNGLSDPLRARFPHLAGHRALALDAAAIEQVPSILKGQIIVAGKDESGAVVSATRVQTAGVLDDLFTYDGPLGLELSSRKKATFRLWAPTARWVCLHVYDQSKQEIASIDMSEGERGVWSASEPQDASWYGSYYNYEVYVFSPVALEYPAGDARMVTDPYSVGLSANSRHSMIVDLGDSATKPEGWDQLAKPELAAPEDIVIYEAHIRDFSISDETVPLEHRGKYVAFSYDGSSPERPMSNGMRHLIALAEAGMSHLHILPAFDIATIDEDPMSRVDLDDTFERLCERNPTVPTQDCTAYAGQTIREVLASLDPSTGDAQRISGYLRELDGFNWGYDPFHYTTPEGSYSTDPDGIARILELRQMVQSLAHNGLRVAFDVVYNHTYASGLREKSVLDKIVPGYYHRLNPETGEIERSTCCDNTASEHAMMEKLMIDSLRVWATQYKIDSFRFDLMGHHMKANILAVQRELASLTLAADGVDGSKIYIYGEGWDFGEVGNDARGVNATQLNMAGTGIGTFSDRLRDAVRGGGPFDVQASLRGNQGFINGMYYDPNELNGRSAGEQLDTLLLLADQIRVGMAGNLRDFVVIDRTGNPVKGSSVRYNGAPAGYTEDPQEVITYVAKHDNQTLFDINQYKLPTGTSMANRVRVQNLGASIVLLGQGIPFVHMGMDMLRSKSMERDSYDSGDWFNEVDFTYRSNNWNVGLPRADKDEANWPIIGPIIANAIIDPQPQHNQAAAAHFREMLQVRKSSRLFRLETKDEVRTRVDFYNVGPEQIPGLIVMSITDGTCAGADLDPGLDSVLVLINAGDLTQLFNLPGAAGFELHPVLAASADPVVRTATFTRIDELTSEFRVPARTAAVFIQPQAGAQGDGLPCNDKVAASVLTASVFVRGTMNDWSAPAAAQLLEDPLDDSRYIVELVLDAQIYELKIADDSWSTYNWGINSGSITPGDGSHGLVSSGGNIVLTISKAGTYRFTLGVNDIDNPTLQVDARP